MASKDVSLRLTVAGRREAAAALGATKDDVVAIGTASRSTSSLLSRAFGGIASLGKTVARGAVIGTAALGGLAATALGVGIRTAAAGEQASIAFTTMLGSGEKATAFLGQLQDFAAKTPFDFPSLQTAASSLVSVGISADDVIPIMTSLGNATSGMGTGAEGVKRATIALQQMSAAGKISGEDLNQLRDAGVPVFDLLASATGKSTEAIAQMAAKGKLGKQELEQLMEALKNGKGLERFAGLMDKQSESLTGKWSTLVDTIQMGLAKVAAPWLPYLKQGLTAVTSLATTFLAAATIKSQEFADKAPAAIEKVKMAFYEAQDVVRGFVATFKDPSLMVYGDTLGAKIVRIGAFLGTAWVQAKSLVSQLREGKDVTGPMGATVNTLRDGFAGMAASLKGVDLKAVFGAGSESLGSLSTLLQVTGVVTGFLVQHLDTLAAAMPFILAAFILWKAAAVAQVAIAIIQLPVTIAQTAASLLQGAAMLSLSAAIQGLTGVQNQSIASKIKDTIVTTAQRVAMVATAVATKVASAAVWLFNAALRANPIGIVVTVLSLLVAGFILAYKKVGWFRDGVNLLWAGMKVLWDWVKKVGSAIGTYLIEKLVSAIGWIKKVVDKMRSVPGVGTLIQGAEAVGGAIAGRATGGPVTGGTPYVVGEKRPELFVPSTSGTIIPQVPSTASIDGSMAGAGGRPLAVNIQVDSKTIAQATISGLRVVQARA